MLSDCFQENMGWKRWSPSRSVTCAKEPLAKVQCLAETMDCVSPLSPPSLSRSDKFLQVSTIIVAASEKRSAGLKIKMVARPQSTKISFGAPERRTVIYWKIFDRTITNNFDQFRFYVYSVWCDNLEVMSSNIGHVPGNVTCDQTCFQSNQYCLKQGSKFVVFW